MPRSRVRWCEGPCSLATSGGGGTDADGKAMTGEGTLQSSTVYGIFLCSAAYYPSPWITQHETSRGVQDHGPL